MLFLRRELVLGTLGLVACGGGGGGGSSGSSTALPPPPPPATGLYPNYNTNPLAPDSNGMGSTAAMIQSRIKLGWNIGNTLEATGGETAWGNPLITKAFVDLVKASGFDAIRLPASWNQYADQTTAKISDTWLNRVKDVVQFCVDAGLYVTLNVHWDGGWLENNISAQAQESVKAKQKAFWEQIATHLRAFDEHLMFASANEPAVDTAQQMAILLDYHQTFIDAVRSTGGKNAYRTLILQGPSTDIDKTNTLWQQAPRDTASNRIMMEVHFYTPYNFTIMPQDETWGNRFFYWGQGFHSTTDTAHNPTWGEEPEVDRLCALMKTKFVDAGIPVIIGEFGATRRDNLTGGDLALHLASRAYWHKYVTTRANSNGLAPFVWDTGAILDRSNLTIKDQQLLDALLQGAGKA